ncbi:metallophosphoesterase [Ancylobacter terrae]|uniref:metallophosphoesterase n=1 Tax=Ancylobacter sp. sgz301288 TaxID=3342077 RepID=UPI0038584A72
MTRLISRRSLLAGATLLVSGSGAYAGYVEPAWRLAVTTYRPRPANWPDGFRLTIAVLTDFHVGEPVMGLGRVDQIIDQTNALKPDLIVLLGDYPNNNMLATRLVPLPDFARRLSNLKAPLGVWSVLGNHDWWSDEEAMRRRRGPTNVTRALEAAGIPVLENQSIRLVHNGQPFWLAGLGDTLAFWERDIGAFEDLLIGMPRPPGKLGIDDLPATLAQCTDAAPVILLAHEPDIFVRVPARVALTLSGHTHGGQVSLAGWSPRVPSVYGRRFRYGQIVEDDRHLIVSGGLGCSKLPIRFGVPPEIVKIELGAA